MGYPDPEVLFERLTSGDVGRITDVDESVTSAAQALDRAASGVDRGMSTASAGWDGVAASAFLDRGRQTTDAMGEALRLMARITTAVRGAAVAYGGLTTTAGRIIQVWRDRSATADEAKLARQVNLALHAAGEGYERALTASLDTLAGTESDPGRFGLFVLLKELVDPNADGPVIPHTQATGDDEGWVPQGLAYHPDNDRLLVSYYNEDDVTDSLLSVIDENSGEEVSSTRLGGLPSPLRGIDLTAPPNHSGGVAVDGDNVWVTSTENDGEDSYVYRYSLADIEAAGEGETVPATGKFPVAASSYATFADGKLWVGSFEPESAGTLYSYDVDSDGGVSDDPSSAQLTPKEVQGVVVRDDELVFSQSEGRNNPGHLLTQRRDDPLGYLYAKNRDMPNMSEGIAEVDGDIVTLYESGAAKYADGNWPRDRMTRTPIEELTGEGFHVEHTALTDAAGEFDTATDAITTSAETMSRTQLLPAVLGQVPTAKVFGSVVTGCVAAVGNTLTTGTQSVRDMADGLVDSAKTYREREDAALNLFGLFN